jgi:hypothetical protein
MMSSYETSSVLNNSRSAGVETENHPLHDNLDLSEEQHPANPHLAGELTATYPEVLDKAHGRKVISNYPNQGVRPSLRPTYNANLHLSSADMHFLSSF